MLASALASRRFAHREADRKARGRSRQNDIIEGKARLNSKSQAGLPLGTLRLQSAILERAPAGDCSLSNAHERPRQGGAGGKSGGIDKPSRRPPGTREAPPTPRRSVRKRTREAGRQDRASSDRASSATISPPVSRGQFLDGFPYPVGWTTLPTRTLYLLFAV